MSNSNDPRSNLFIYIKMFFEKPDEFDELPDYVYKKHWFMLNRFLAKGFPLQANMVNSITNDPICGTKMWFSQLRGRYTKTPSFIYTKAEEAKKKSRDWWPQENTIMKYCQTNQISKKDFELYMVLGGEQFVSVVKKLDNMLNGEVTKSGKKAKKKTRTLV